MPFLVLVRILYKIRDALSMLCRVCLFAEAVWICARHPEKTTGQVRSDLRHHPAKLVRIMMKGGMQ